MIKFEKIYFPKALVFLSLLLLPACAEEPAAPAVPVKTKVNAAKKTPPPAKKEDTKEEKKEKEKPKTSVYNYDPLNKRDPFRPYWFDLERGAEGEEEVVEEVPLTELEKFALTQFRLVAVVVTSKKQIAMVEDPNGVGHTLKIGTLIGQNKGRVIKFEQGIVYVEEKSRDVMGNLTMNLRELRIETSEGGEK